MPRERHQKGWIVVSGRTEKKWIGHWMPWRADGTRTHERVVLGLKSKLTKWEAQDKLRAHIAEQEKRPGIRGGSSIPLGIRSSRKAEIHLISGSAGGRRL